MIKIDKKDVLRKLKKHDLEKPCSVCESKEAKLIMGDEGSLVKSYYCSYHCLGKRTAKVKNVKLLK